MKKLTILQVGKVFTDYNNGNVKLEVVKQEGCDGCFYNKGEYFDCRKHTSSLDTLACGCLSRGILGNDYVSVIFKKI